VIPDYMKPTPGLITSLDSGQVTLRDTRLGESLEVYPPTLEKVSLGTFSVTAVWATGGEYEGFIPVDCISWASKEKDLRAFNTVL